MRLGDCRAWRESIESFPIAVSPYTVIGKIDYARKITVCIERDRARERVAPDGVVGCIDGLVGVKNALNAYPQAAARIATHSDVPSSQKALAELLVRPATRV